MHIIIESIVFICLIFYFSKNLKQYKSIIEDLSSKIEDLEERLEILEGKRMIIVIFIFIINF